MNCNVSQTLIGNGICNTEANVEDCNFDDGDCCSAPLLIDNGFCNEETNNVNCNYDGGDCQCAFGRYGQDPYNVGGGWCQDYNNHEGCNFDGGDCCGPNNIYILCTECLCLGTATTSGTTTTSGECIQSWIGDGWCDDENNNDGCNFDGGDCCGDNVNTQYCSECLCLNWSF